MKLFKKPSKGLKIIGMSIPFVVIGIWMIHEWTYGTSEYVMGWICTLFFGLGIPIGIFQTFDRRPQIILNLDSIWDRTTNQNPILWEQIVSAYNLDISGQKFICLVTDSSFILKKLPNKIAAKIGKSVGAQSLNLSLSQIDIDENRFSDLINQLAKSKREDRKKIILTFENGKVKFPISKLYSVVFYILVSIALLFFLLTTISAFMVIMFVTAGAALLLRWYSGSDVNSKLRKYCNIIVWLGFINMPLSLFTAKTYDYATERVEVKLLKGISKYKEVNYIYPTRFDLVKTNSELNLFEEIVAKTFKYEATDFQYTLKARRLFKNNAD